MRFGGLARAGELVVQAVRLALPAWSVRLAPACRCAHAKGGRPVLRRPPCFAYSRFCLPALGVQPEDDTGRHG